MAKYNRGRKSKALQEATDLTQGGAFADIVAPPRMEGDPTGQTTALEQQAEAISPIQEQSTPTGSMPNLPPMNVSAPTNKMSEPVTAGIPIGAGDNGGMPIATDTVANIFKAAKRVMPDPIWDELLEADFDIG
mgnify:FL=1